MNKARHNNSIYSKPFIITSVFRLIFLLCLLYFASVNNNLFSQNCSRADFRTIDGSCNNLFSKERGSTHTPLLRELPAQYGSDDRQNSLKFPNRPNPRAISNVIFQQNNESGNKANLSSFVFTWGQFIDHDITIVELDRSASVPIPLPVNEPDFTKPIAFNRSAFIPETGNNNPRNQENALTAWVDASQVYGTDIDRANWLRTFQNGKLKTSAGNRLPYNTIDGQKSSAIDINAPSMDPAIDEATKVFIAGDARAFEQPGLTSLHTLFMREHNRICEELIQLGYLDDEYIYQIARKRIGALIQVITYQEFLPALGVELNNYSGYKDWVNPEIMNLFATAGFRFGHTMVTNELLVLDDNCTEINAPIPLDQAFLTGRWVEQFNIAPILKGLSVSQQEEMDAKVIDGLRNFLFTIPQNEDPFGLDLAALNIQRGRDHGIPTYTTVRKHFLGQDLIAFNEITSNIVERRRLEYIYDNIDDIDLWVGLMAEDHLQGSNIGPTLHEILRIQFERLRDGDFYYYQNDPLFNTEEKDVLTNTKLSQLIKRNTPLKNIPLDVFHANPCQAIVANFTCNDVLVIADNGQITIANLASGAKVELSGPSTAWVQELVCEGNCNNSINLNNLIEGDYNITVQTFNPYCYKLYTVNIGESTDDCAEQGVDSDGDGICDNQDNCDFTSNADQADNDNDGIGNVCDDSPNGNSGDCNSIVAIGKNRVVSLSNVPSGAKVELSGPSTAWVQELVCEGNCNNSINLNNLIEGDYNITVQTFNPYCYKLYTVTIGESTDDCAEQGGDSDGDGICDNQDNCGFTSNADQTDNDNDGIGNVCDDTPNGETGENSDCDELSANITNGKLTVSGLNAPIVILKVFDSNWNNVFECNGDKCPETVIFSADPNEVTCHLDVQFYTSDWQLICSKQLTVNANAGATGRSAAQLDFVAIRANRTIELQWVTNTGWKNDYFIIEKSTNGQSFEAISEIVNTDDSDDMTYYENNDLTPESGTNYYRIKQIYKDGSFDYTAIRTVDFNIDLNGISLFPNPADNELFISLKPFVGKEGVLTITNQFGQITQQIELGEINEDLVKINTTQLLNGLYYLNVNINHQKSFTKKIMIQRLY